MCEGLLTFLILLFLTLLGFPTPFFHVLFLQPKRVPHRLASVPVVSPALVPLAFTTNPVCNFGSHRLDRRSLFPAERRVRHLFADMLALLRSIQLRSFTPLRIRIAVSTTQVTKWTANTIRE